MHNFLSLSLLRALSTTIIPASGGWWVDYTLSWGVHAAGLKIWTFPARSRVIPDHDIAEDWGIEWHNAIKRLTHFLLNADKQGSLEATLAKNLASVAGNHDSSSPTAILLFTWLQSQEPLSDVRSWERERIVGEHDQCIRYVFSTPTTRAVAQRQGNCPSTARLPEGSDGHSCFVARFICLVLSSAERLMWWAVHKSFALSVRVSRVRKINESHFANLHNELNLYENYAGFCAWRHDKTS